MNIEFKKNDKKIVKFEDIGVAEPFIYTAGGDNIVYMKMSTTYRDDRNSNLFLNSVRLRDGYPRGFCKDELVIPVEANIEIDND